MCVEGSERHCSPEVSLPTGWNGLIVFPNMLLREAKIYQIDFGSVAAQNEVGLNFRGGLLTALMSL